MELLLLRPCLCMWPLSSLCVRFVCAEKNTEKLAEKRWSSGGAFIAFTVYQRVLVVFDNLANGTLSSQFPSIAAQLGEGKRQTWLRWRTKKVENGFIVGASGW